MASDASDQSSSQPNTSDVCDASDSVSPTNPRSSSAGTITLDSNPAGPRKRKTPASVTLNACTNCKKARSKCDGQKPACQRCINRHVPHACLYEMHSKAAKDQMMGEIERLRTENQHLVQRNAALGEMNDLLDRVVRSLKNDRQSHEIIRRLKRGENHQSIAKWLGRPLAPELGSISPESERRFDMAIEQYRQRWVESQDPCYWTNVTSDGMLVEHLVTLYLTWIHPLHTLFDEGRFMSSFRECVDVYCSPTLVNAICAMACHTLRSEWRGEDVDDAGIDHLQSRFMDEVEELMTDLDGLAMTSIQTWAVMFLVELGLGNGLMANAHLRHASDSLIAQSGQEQEKASAEVSSWGILTLTTTWSGLVYQKPYNAPIASYASGSDEVPMESFRNGSRSRRHSHTDGDDLRPDYSLISACEQAKLYRIVHEMLLAYCGSRGKVVVLPLLSIYERLLSWRKDLPISIRDVRAEDEAPPHQLFLHIQYHVIVIQALQPMLHLKNTDEASKHILIKDIVEHAQMAFELLVQYRETHTCSHQSPIQLFCTVHICDALVQYNPAHGTIPEVVELGLRSLEEAQLNYPIARVLRDSFRQVVVERHLDLPTKIRQQLEGKSPFLPHDIQNALTRSTYQQPVAQMLPIMDDSLGRDFAEQLVRRAKSKPGTAPTGRHGRSESMQIKSVLN